MLRVSGECEDEGEEDIGGEARGSEGCDIGYGAPCVDPARSSQSRLSKFSSRCEPHAHSPYNENSTATLLTYPSASGSKGGSSNSTTGLSVGLKIHPLGNARPSTFSCAAISNKRS